VFCLMRSCLIVKSFETEANKAIQAYEEEKRRLEEGFSIEITKMNIVKIFFAIVRLERTRCQRFV
jgi:hypothetical protein